MHGRRRLPCAALASPRPAPRPALEPCLPPHITRAARTCTTQTSWARSSGPWAVTESVEPEDDEEEARWGLRLRCPLCLLHPCCACCSCCAFSSSRPASSARRPPLVRAVRRRPQVARLPTPLGRAPRAPAGLRLPACAPDQLHLACAAAAARLLHTRSPAVLHCPHAPTDAAGVDRQRALQPGHAGRRHRPRQARRRARAGRAENVAPSSAGAGAHPASLHSPCCPAGWLRTARLLDAPPDMQAVLLTAQARRQHLCASLHVMLLLPRALHQPPAVLLPVGPSTVCMCLSLSPAPAQDIAAVLSFLHSRDILHGDVHCGNCLLAGAHASPADPRGYVVKASSCCCLQPLRAAGSECSMQGRRAAQGRRRGLVRD